MPAQVVDSEDVAEWLSHRRRTPAEKEAAFSDLVARHGYAATIGIWHAGLEQHRRRRSTCRAARETWELALRPDDDGKLLCPGCGDRVPVIVNQGWAVIEPHRVAPDIPTCGVDYPHKVHGLDTRCHDCHAPVEVPA